jgi:hypothetical protein
MIKIYMYTIMSDKQVKFITDTATVGLLNLAAMYVAQKLYPNNFLLQAFISGSLFHLSMKFAELS